jgi:hypothetical protein
MQPAELHASFLRWLGGHPDDDVLRWLYRVLLAATVTVLVLDYADLETAVQERAAGPPSIEQPAAQPVPSSRRDGGSRRPVPRQADATLNEVMKFELVGDGRLIAAGTIMPGTAKAFAAEIAKRGSYVKTVVLHSPGGSVSDALAMGRLIREKKFATEVEKGKSCASSCPLVFAGGIDRRAGQNASIGVHQVSALSAGPLSGADGMENAQQISAACQKFLRDMGIDLEVWVHAMETPKDELYYFRPEEMLALRLATQADGGKTRAVSRTKS